MKNGFSEKLESTEEGERDTQGYTFNEHETR